MFSENPLEIPSDILTFPSLLFQVVGSAFQFIPSDYDRSLDDLRKGKSFDDLAKTYSDSGFEMLAIFERESLNLSSVQAGFLRVGLLKSFGYPLEAFRLVGHIIADALDIGLHQESAEQSSEENMPSRLWYHEMRRRVMVNLWLWDKYVAPYSLHRPMKVYSVVVK